MKPHSPSRRISQRLYTLSCVGGTSNSGCRRPSLANTFWQLRSLLRQIPPRCFNMALDSKKHVEAMYEKITQKMRPTYSDPGAFICEHDLIAIWSDTQDIRQTFEPHSLSQQIMAQMKDVRLLKVLSIFILIEWPDIGQFERFLDTFPVD